MRSNLNLKPPHNSGFICITAFHGGDGFKRNTFHAREPAPGVDWTNIEQKIYQVPQAAASSLRREMETALVPGQMHGLLELEARTPDSSQAQTDVETIRSHLRRELRNAPAAGQPHRPLILKAREPIFSVDSLQPRLRWLLRHALEHLPEAEENVKTCTPDNSQAQTDPEPLKMRDVGQIDGGGDQARGRVRHLGKAPLNHWHDSASQRDPLGY
ncbi:hypothetical protein WOLCODRAFT_162464 [Wolfiporia cocos MD-104 SS10]|uniref:Uncharacterized protein n=1 Tax=Wolfiporia cocos (strain MD-104) TaxID=742152 RepID=A0A2H3JVG3_WOLCO|nr:hypothetical protein WOLCODRAFT_162464 [Wolfiporia cocos MD-104 SS10]